MTSDERPLRDWTAEPTLPGMARRRARSLDDTDDEREHITPAERPSGRIAEINGRAIVVGLKAAELVGLPGSTWGRGVDADLARMADELLDLRRDLDARVAATPRRKVVVMAIRLAKGLTVGMVLAALLMAGRALIAHGDSTAMSRERDAMIHRHDRQIARAINVLTLIAGKLGLVVYLDDTSPKDPP